MEALALAMLLKYYETKLIFSYFIRRLSTTKLKLTHAININIKITRDYEKLNSEANEIHQELPK